MKTGGDSMDETNSKITAALLMGLIIGRDANDKPFDSDLMLRRGEQLQDYYENSRAYVSQEYPELPPLKYEQVLAYLKHMTSGSKECFKFYDVQRGEACGSAGSGERQGHRDGELPGVAKAPMRGAALIAQASAAPSAGTTNAALSLFQNLQPTKGKLAMWYGGLNEEQMDNILFSVCTTEYAGMIMKMDDATHLKKKEDMEVLLEELHERVDARFHDIFPDFPPIELEAIHAYMKYSSSITEYFAHFSG